MEACPLHRQWVRLRVALLNAARLRATAFVFAVVVVGLSTDSKTQNDGQHPTAPLLITDDESYAVYAEAIGRKAGDKPLLLSQETTTGPTVPGCGMTARWEPEWKPVAANFIQANSTRHLLLPNRPLG